MLLEACIVSIVMPEPRTFSNRVLVLLKKTQKKQAPSLQSWKACAWISMLVIFVVGYDEMFKECKDEQIVELNYSDRQ